MAFKMTSVCLYICLLKMSVGLSKFRRFVPTSSISLCKDKFSYFACDALDFIGERKEKPAGIPRIICSGC